MSDMILMDILNSINDLLEVEASSGFINWIVLNIFVEFSLGGKFHNDEDICGCIKDFIEFDDVGMINKFEDSDLFFDLTERRCTLEIIFLFFIFFLFRILTATSIPVNVCLASVDMKSITFDFGKSATANSFTEGIIADPNFLHHWLWKEYYYDGNYIFIMMMDGNGWCNL